MMCCNVRTHWLEKIGIIIILVGSTFMILDPSTIKNGQQVNVWVSALCFLPGIPYAFFFVGNDYLKQYFSMYFLMIQSIFANLLIAIMLALMIEGATFDFSDRGIFGYLRPDAAPISFIGNGIMTCFFGCYGLVLSMKYFSAVFVMNCILLMPLISQVIGVMLGID